MANLKVVLFTRKPLPDWTEAIVSEMRGRGHEVTVTDQVVAGYDCGWLRLLPEDHKETAPRHWLAALDSEAQGLPLLNNSQSRELAANKLDLFSALKDAGLKTPVSWAIEDAPESYPMVCKPLSGSRGEDVVIVKSKTEAEDHQRAVGRPCLVQEIIDTKRCLRVVATPEQVVSAYEKKPQDGQFVIAISLGAERQEAEITAEIAAMARAMVTAVDGDLCGCDIIEDRDGHLWALEVNTSFAFAADNNKIIEAYGNRLEEISCRR